MSPNSLYLFVSVLFIGVLVLFLCIFRTNCYERTFIQILICLFMSALTGACAVVAFGWGMDMASGNIHTPSVRLEWILCGAIGGGASRLLSVIFRRVNNVLLLNLDDIAEMRDAMSHTERLAHAVECPFRKEHELLWRRHYTTGITVDDIPGLREVRDETSGELSGCHVGLDPMVGLYEDRIAEQRESAVDNRLENRQ